MEWNLPLPVAGSHAPCATSDCHCQCTLNPTISSCNGPNPIGYRSKPTSPIIARLINRARFFECGTRLTRVHPSSKTLLVTRVSAKGQKLIYLGLWRGVSLSIHHTSPLCLLSTKGLIFIPLFVKPPSLLSTPSVPRFLLETISKAAIMPQIRRNSVASLSIPDVYGAQTELEVR